MSRHCKLSAEEAEALWQDYCRWLEARRNWHPKKLAQKYGVDTKTIYNYVHGRHSIGPRRKAA